MSKWHYRPQFYFRSCVVVLLELSGAFTKFSIYLSCQTWLAQSDKIARTSRRCSIKGSRQSNFVYLRCAICLILCAVNCDAWRATSCGAATRLSCRDVRNADCCVVPPVVEAHRAMIFVLLLNVPRVVPRAMFPYSAPIVLLQYPVSLEHRFGQHLLCCATVER